MNLFLPSPLAARLFASGQIEILKLDGVSSNMFAAAHQTIRRAKSGNRVQNTGEMSDAGNRESRSRRRQEEESLLVNIVNKNPELRARNRIASNGTRSKWQFKGKSEASFSG